MLLSSSYTFVIAAALIAAAVLPMAGQAFADPLKNAYKQRIGNYDFEMTTEPKNPTTGAPTKILLRIAGVNGDDLVDVPIRISIAKLGSTTQVVEKTNPIVVPYGHYAYEYTFSEPGRYVVYVDLNDYAYSGETLQFTFFVNVAGPFDYLYSIAAAAGAVAAAGVGAVVFMKRKRRHMESLK